MFPSCFHSRIPTGFKQWQALGGHPKLSFLLDFVCSIMMRACTAGVTGVKSDPPAPCPLELKRAPSLPRRQAGHSPGEWTDRVKGKTDGIK